MNIAARLEELSGAYGSSLLVGPTMEEAVGGQSLLREIDAVAVKGRAEPLTVYEPVTPLDEATAREADMVVRYAEALGHYRARRFEQAADIWLSLGADDGPAGVMAQRSRAYQTAPPPQEWDGVFVMSGK